MQKELQEEMAGTLMAISVVSKSLAKRIMKGEKDNEEKEISSCGKEYEKSCR